MNSQTEYWVGAAPPHSCDVMALHFRNVDASDTLADMLGRDSTGGGITKGRAALESSLLAGLMKPEPADDPAIDVAQVAREAREQGMRDAIAQSDAQIQSVLAKERQNIAHALEDFVLEKRRYFAGLEREVVRLSLAIAERVLHRESEMDPMLLAGAARVALEQVNIDADAVLRVSTEQFSAWQDTIRKECKSVHVVADAALEKGACVLEAKSGSIEFGVRAQLQEIERGFFELLKRNPSAAG